MKRSRAKERRAIALAKQKDAAAAISATVGIAPPVYPQTGDADARATLAAESLAEWLETLAARVENLAQIEKAAAAVKPKRTRATKTAKG